MEESCMEKRLYVNKKKKHLVHKPTRLKSRYCTVKVYISFRNLWMDQPEIMILFFRHARHAASYKPYI